MDCFNRSRNVLSYLLRARSLISFLCIVDFDLDYGPKVTSVYPSHTLSDSETENMSVNL